MIRIEHRERVGEYERETLIEVNAADITERERDALVKLFAAIAGAENVAIETGIL